MRINSVQNNGINFKSLQIRNVGQFYYKDFDLKRSQNRLANTKILDVVIDSHGLSIKEKMTEALHQIQSFSLFPQENSIAINMINEKEPFIKFKYDSIKKAKAVWEKLLKIDNTQSNLEKYTLLTLWLEKCFTKQNKSSL